ncbi:MAG: phage tail tube protein [Eubacteriales bacterium]|nr:phage tail tube protein [Eubacteriales bacterium]
MTIANSVNKNVIVGVQSAKGTVCAADLATAQTMRFTKFTQNQTNETYTSNEMRPDKQVGDVNLGPQSMDGSCSGELSPATYKTFMAALLRKAWVAGEVSGPESDFTIAVTSGAAFTLTSAANATFITDGLKVGDVVRFTGFVVTGTDARANNDHNALITALTETVLTGVFLDGVAAVAKAETEAVTVTVVGKKLWIPPSSHTEDWLSIEHNYSDVDLSEVFKDCKISSMAIKAPATGIPTVDFNILGLDGNFLLSAASPYFSAALPITTTEAVLSGKALILVGGTVKTLATSLDLDISGNNQAMAAVIGTNVKPGISDGRIEVKGTISIYFENATERDLFRNGTEVAIYAVFPVSDEPDADFISISMPTAKLTSATKDGDKEIIQSIPFQAKFNSAGDDGATCTVNTLATTISIQDSAA